MNENMFPRPGKDSLPQGVLPEQLLIPQALCSSRKESASSLISPSS